MRSIKRSRPPTTDSLCAWCGKVAETSWKCCRMSLCDVCHARGDEFIRLHHICTFTLDEWKERKVTAPTLETSAASAPATEVKMPSMTTMLASSTREVSASSSIVEERIRCGVVVYAAGKPMRSYRSMVSTAHIPDALLQQGGYDILTILLNGVHLTAESGEKCIGIYVEPDARVDRLKMITASTQARISLTGADAHPLIFA